MNRILLIGNGFDLAHGMKTSYKSFIDDYWENTTTEIKKIGYGDYFENDEIKIINSPSTYLRGNTFKNLQQLANERKFKVEFKNVFLSKITDKSSLTNWVDIENEYFDLLKESYSKDNRYDITQLNSDFEQIKLLLKRYLAKIEEEFKSNHTTHISNLISSIRHKIYQPFCFKDFSEEALNQIVEMEHITLKERIDALHKNQISKNDFSEFQKIIFNNDHNNNDHKTQIRNELLSDSSKEYYDKIPNQTLFLNFNYTFTELNYKVPKKFLTHPEGKTTSIEFNHIHGTTENSNNDPIIFGFGDEIDKDYKSIEELNDNHYLKNIK